MAGFLAGVQASKSETPTQEVKPDSPLTTGETKGLFTLHKLNRAIPSVCPVTQLTGGSSRVNLTPLWS